MTTAMKCYLEIINRVYSSPWLIIELLETLLNKVRNIDSALYFKLIPDLAWSYQNAGEPKKAVDLISEISDLGDLNDSFLMWTYSDAKRLIGSLLDSELIAQRAIVHARRKRKLTACTDYSGFQSIFGGKHIRDRVMSTYPEAQSLHALGLTLAACGEVEFSEDIFEKCLTLIKDLEQPSMDGLTAAKMAQQMLWSGNPQKAREFADKAWESAQFQSPMPHLIQAARLQGEACLFSGELSIADEKLNYAIERAREGHYIEEELQCIVDISRLYFKRGENFQARQILLDHEDWCVRGPYRLIHADLKNLLTEIEIDSGNKQNAITCAREAFVLALCDGFPYVYKNGISMAMEHLRILEEECPLSHLPCHESDKVTLSPKEQYRILEDKVYREWIETREADRQKPNLEFSEDVAQHQSSKTKIENKLKKALSVIDTKTFREEERELNRLIKEFPQFGLVHFILGVMYDQQQNMRLAVDSYKSSIAYQPDLGQAYLKLYDCYTRLGDMEMCYESLCGFYENEPSWFERYPIADISDNWFDPCVFLEDLAIHLNYENDLIDLYRSQFSKDINIAHNGYRISAFQIKIGKHSEALETIEYLENVSSEILTGLSKFVSGYLKSIALLKLNRLKESKEEISKHISFLEEVLSEKSASRESKAFYSYKKGLYSLLSDNNQIARSHYEKASKVFHDLKNDNVILDLKEHVKLTGDAESKSILIDIFGVVDLDS